jgi:hypothetical protein
LVIFLVFWTLRMRRRTSRRLGISEGLLASAFGLWWGCAPNLHELSVVHSVISFFS